MFRYFMKFNMLTYFFAYYDLHDWLCTKTSKRRSGPKQQKSIYIFTKNDGPPIAIATKMFETGSENRINLLIHIERVYKGREISLQHTSSLQDLEVIPNE